jgi:hypothetical protein
MTRIRVETTGGGGGTCTGTVVVVVVVVEALGGLDGALGETGGAAKEGVSSDIMVVVK